VSIVVAALNEAGQIERAVRSMLAQRYEPVEVIAVDDRSTDETGAILDRMAAVYPALRVLHIDALPAGWLGKNHALHRGAELATGDLLLFTDADVVYAPDAIGRSVAYFTRQRADHLALGPALEVPSIRLALVVNFFTLWFTLYMKPWRASVPDSRFHLGIGAFNMIRASLYRSFGGHAPIALRPDDDLKLGKLVKRAGGRQIVASGAGAISVRWYDTLGDLARGFRKNTFAGLEYSIPLVIGAVIGQLLLNVWPFVAPFVVDGTARWLYVATAATLIAMYATMAHVGGNRPWLAVFYPVAALAFLWIIVAATVRTLRRGGIEWRDTFYSLADLRRNDV
jgi:glycosyltransferase involved in cell wall biosynthesis